MAEDTNKTGKDDSGILDAAEKGAEKVKDAIGMALDAAKHTADSIQAAIKSSDSPQGIAVTKGFEFARQNISSLFEFGQKIVKAGSLEEANKIQAEFVRTQSAAIGRQVEEIKEIVSGKGAAEGGGSSPGSSTSTSTGSGSSGAKT